MAHYFIVTLLIFVVRALLAHGCGTLLDTFFGWQFPNLPHLFCTVAGVMLAVLAVESLALLIERTIKAKTEHAAQIALAQEVNFANATPARLFRQRRAWYIGAAIASTLILAALTLFMV
jgi:hypothetical protein